MNQDTATLVANATGGKAHNTGGGVWLVFLPCPSGACAVISVDCVCVYETEREALSAIMDGEDIAPIATSDYCE